MAKVTNHYHYFFLTLSITVLFFLFFFSSFFFHFIYLFLFIYFFIYFILFIYLFIYFYFFFRHFRDYLFVKQVSIFFTKFHCKIACAMGTRDILVNGSPTQILKPFEDWTKFSICTCNSVKHNRKSRLTSLLHMYDVYVTSYATFFDEAFLFYVSILLI